ncbi:MAG: hypothetical protein OEL56_06915 [Nitrosopumilus sp.]|nr:hypothetical protein [Nitrosopumilus sp.]MDH3490163.1 hypothetical protein [Nitrosopumilus sp.]MDH3516902.1 hypothetical protein [Nitrosopumilus sp.]MDH3565277.1 hypothetical protein [Nitrosopumilus sp.]MDH5416667.1 hypothetical protein [Nitrosopumilus sp.]
MSSILNPRFVISLDMFSYFVISALIGNDMYATKESAEFTLPA